MYRCRVEVFGVSGLGLSLFQGFVESWWFGLGESRVCWGLWG